MAVSNVGPDRAIKKLKVVFDHVLIAIEEGDWKTAFKGMAAIMKALQSMMERDELNHIVKGGEVENG